METPMTKQELMGRTVKDRIHGFKGVVTGFVSYITGCDQVLVQPQALNEKGEPVEARWIDVQRVEVLGEASRIALDNGTTPGPDMPAPIR